MRRTAPIRCPIEMVALRAIALGLLVFLAGCTLGSGLKKAPDAAVNPITGGEIATSTLEAAAPAASAPVADSGPKPLEPLAATAPAMQTTALQATPAPVVPLTPEGQACVKKGGVWQAVGKSGSMTCVKFTKDSGKVCSKASQCEGYCLARSGTCAPVTPMFGCNDILQDNGGRVTLCID
jgi:hypothetical protein